MDAHAQHRLSVNRKEFIALLAMLMALNALAIDIMLPGMQQIGIDLGETDPNRRQYIVTAYLVGFGGAQILFGPLSDYFGRKPPLLAGLGIYFLAAVAALFAADFNTLLILRFIQGLGAASTRVLTVAMARDLAGGRRMAEIMSFVMMVFMIIPIIAPALGQLILQFGTWPSLFLFMAVDAAIVSLWLVLRIPETLDPQFRRPIEKTKILEGIRQVFTNRYSFWYTAATTFFFASLFALINSAQQIYVGIYDLGALFPLAFAAVALLMAVSSYLNARLVIHLGMRRLAHTALILFLCTSLAIYGLSLFGRIPFPVFMTLMALTMFFFNFVASNFSAIAMEPMGHLAGIASSIQGTAQTTLAALIGAAIGQSFDGTVTPIMLGFAIAAGISLFCVLIGERGRLFSAN